MKRPNQICLAAMTAVAALLLTSPTPALAQKGGGKPPPPVYPYKFTDLGQPAYNNGQGARKAYGVTEPDEVGVSLIVGAGDSQPSPYFTTAWEAKADGLLSANAVPGSYQGPAAVNDAGMIAFYGYSESKAAYVGMVNVPGVGTAEFPWSSYRPQALNNLGQVVLAWFHTAYLWTVNNDGTTSSIVVLDDFYPSAINDWGLMAGQQVSTGAAAIAWFEEGVLQVQTLPGLYSGNYGRAAGINNFGEVVGVSTTYHTSNAGLAGAGYIRPFLWRPTEGLLGLADSGAALDINDRGQVVGWSYTANGFSAFLWENGQLFNLNSVSGVGTKSFQLGTAEAINEAGHIVGRSDIYKGNSIVGGSSYLLTPNP